MPKTAAQNPAENPVLNSPYEEPTRHWELEEGSGKMTDKLVERRRESGHYTPVPKPEKADGGQGKIALKEKEERTKVNFIRQQVKKWRALPLEKRGVTRETQTLLEHWETNPYHRLFFCQREAAETFIWLNEVAPKTNPDLITYLREASNAANPGLSEKTPDLFRIAAKMATGAGKTTVMAMLIAYHAVNKSRHPNRKHYSAHFLVIAPGITIKDRLRVLLPNDPENYYETRALVPRDMLPDIKKAAVVITNYQALKHRETSKIPSKERIVIEGNSGVKMAKPESDWQMLRRACRELLGAKNVVVINDEAHHCYMHKTKQLEEDAEAPITEEDEKEDAKRNTAAARLWINGIKALGREVKIQSICDLSATPFFLRGSGYSEGTLFPWVASDFSLIEAVESGIVKLPRVPVRDTANGEMPVYRDLYENIRNRLPKKGARGQGRADPQQLPAKLVAAMQQLYADYKTVYEQWEKNKIGVPPVFICVCNNTAVSKLVYDRISGYEVDGVWHRGEFKLFDNVADDGGKFIPRPHTLLVDSYQLESGDALTPEFKKAAAAEIELFKREMRIRYEGANADKITDESILREVMNTVGKQGKLGEQIRCVVSVSMLTEGWDTNNVTHILGVRGFGTQLLCEQVVGRALRRFGYTVEGDGKFAPQYAEVYGVPFNFSVPKKPGKAPEAAPKLVRVRHLDERAGLEISFPNLDGYYLQPPERGLTAVFTKNSILDIDQSVTPDRSKQQAIAGKSAEFNLDELKARRIGEVEFELAAYVCRQYFQEEEGDISPARFRDILQIARRYIKNCVFCRQNTFPQYLLLDEIKRDAAERIQRAIKPAKEDGKEILLPIIHPYTPDGSTFYVDFMTGKKRLHYTRENKSHINIAVCDSDWELQFCRQLESRPDVFSYARNEQLGFEVPYKHEGRWRKYRPDFIVLIDDGNGRGNLLKLVVEIKGYRDGNAQAKADTMQKWWIPAVNNKGDWGRWAFAEIMDPQYLLPGAQLRTLEQVADNGWQ